MKRALLAVLCVTALLAACTGFARYEVWCRMEVANGPVPEGYPFRVGSYGSRAEAQQVVDVLADAGWEAWVVVVWEAA